MLNKISKTVVDLDKIKLLSDEERTEMVHFLVRHPYVANFTILKDLIPSDFNWQWLRSMGYLYETKHNGYVHVHTSEAKFGNQV